MTTEERIDRAAQEGRLLDEALLLFRSLSPEDQEEILAQMEAAAAQEGGAGNE